MVFGLINNIEYRAMQTKQMYAESKIDKEHKDLIWDKYSEAHDKIYTSWELKWEKFGRPERQLFTQDPNHFCGPFYIFWN